MTAINAAYEWKCQPKAETLLLEILAECCQRNPFVADLQKELFEQTSTRLFDWIDHVITGYSEQLEKNLEEAGFVSHIATVNYRVFHHPGAQLPQVMLRDNASLYGAAVSVESISDFLMVRGLSRKIDGDPLSSYRSCCVSTEDDSSLFVVERRGTQTFEPSTLTCDQTKTLLLAKQLWKTRPRSIQDEEMAMTQTLKTAEQIVNLVGTGMAAWIVMECEREYWQSRNRAAQLQKNRQDRLGMGWANHDHHTFRSSRKLFSQLVRLFEILGFTCRERYYAGNEAGWGAQIMEHSQCRLVLFLDVDLRSDEIAIDFRHHPLPELNKMSTVGLWCALHGDSILKGGMHHLEAQFMFEDLAQDLAKIGIGMMPAFSDFTYLKQAFTSGERWSVDPKRIQSLLSRNAITQEQADRFLKEGAIGSHLENLQRREGYKGFNQKNVSFIIKKTDPRSA
jgi:hypothetical protein